MQTFYPIFESGQVLTSGHLNSLVSWLEQQDLATRNKTIGIGIVCGLEVSLDPGSEGVRISKGCAITSEGHLIVQEDCLLTHCRKYTLPVSSDVDADTYKIADTISSNYPFFF